MSANGDTYGLFWNSQDGDRTYDADSFEKWLSQFFTTGIFKGGFEVTPYQNLTVSIAGGYANINGKIRLFETETRITLDAASSVSPRIDTIVLERDDNNRQITLKKVTGTASANPSAVSPVRTSSVYQLVLAEIYVAVGASTIAANNITDKRNDANLCGAITNTLNNFLYGTETLVSGTSELPTGTFYFQYD